MKKQKQLYVSCIDKRVIIMCIISIIILVVTSLILNKGGFAPGTLRESVITSTLYWYVILFLFYSSIISFLVSITIFIIGIIFRYSNKRKNSK